MKSRVVLRWLHVAVYLVLLSTGADALFRRPHGEVANSPNKRSNNSAKNKMKSSTNNKKTQPASVYGLSLNSMADEDEEEDALTFIDRSISFSVDLGTLFYGLALVLYSPKFPCQVHIITMMRSMGFAKLEKAVDTWRRNFRRGIRSAIFHAPSLIMMRKSINNLKEQAAESKKIKKEIKKSRADGVVTRQEERKIKKLQDKRALAIKRDIRRLQKGCSTLGRIWDVIDLDEIRDIIVSMLNLMTAVLSSGHSDSMIGSTISRYCHVINLGSLAMDANSKLGFPMSRILFMGEFSYQELDEEERTKVRRFGSVLMYGASTCLFAFRKHLGLRLNAAMLSSAFVVRGLSGLTGSELLAVSKEYKKVGWAGEGAVFMKRFSGTLFVAVTAIAMRCSYWSDKEDVELPKWMLPLNATEVTAKRLVVLADKVT